MELNLFELNDRELVGLPDQFAVAYEAELRSRILIKLREGMTVVLDFGQVSIRAIYCDCDGPLFWFTMWPDGKKRPKKLRRHLALTPDDLGKYVDFTQLLHEEDRVPEFRDQ